MSSKSEAKERFLKNIEGVSKETAFEEINKNTDNLDLYTYFVTKDAFNSGKISDDDINEFLVRLYSDWYFLHKNSISKNPKAIKLLSNESYSPLQLNKHKCLELIKGGEFNDTLPIKFQFTNKLEDRYFISIRTDELYGKQFKNFRYDVRLYINLPFDKLIPFAQEFTDKAYSEPFPALIKILNNDYRCDTVTIYTDYEYAEKVVDIIHEIKNENPSLFTILGPVSPLLGSIDGFIGFGEQLKSNATYFASRCQALSSVNKFASIEALRECIVEDEKDIIGLSKNKTLTITEYLEYLILRNANNMIENRIQELKIQGKDKELDALKNLQKNLREELDVEREVNELKKSLTHKSNYKLTIPQVGEDNYNYVNRLYSLFSSNESSEYEYISEREKKSKINAQIFKANNEFLGIHTWNFLEMYFQVEISTALKELIDTEIESIRSTRQSGVLTNIKKKFVSKLKTVLKAIIDDDDDGKEYIYNCIYDYIRILSTGSMENVQSYIEGREITIEKDVNQDIIEILPDLKQRVAFLSKSPEFIDKTLEQFGINKDNLCINKSTKNILKSRETQEENDYRYYYNPEGYLSK